MSQRVVCKRHQDGSAAQDVEEIEHELFACKWEVLCVDDMDTEQAMGSELYYKLRHLGGGGLLLAPTHYVDFKPLFVRVTH